MTTTAYSAATALALPAIAAASVNDPDDVVKVMAFHHLYEVPIKPFGNQDRHFRHMDNERVALRLSLHIEEFKELLLKGFGITVDMRLLVADVVHNDLKEALDFAEFRAGGPGYNRNGVEVMDALGDLRYVDVGMAIEMGYDPRPVMAEIHAGNMTKLGADGNPVINGVTVGYRQRRVEGTTDDILETEPHFDPTARVGKVLKGPNYVEPNIPAALGWEN